MIAEVCGCVMVEAQECVMTKVQHSGLGGANLSLSRRL